MDGVELAEHIQKTPQFKDTRLVMISSLVQCGDAQQMKEKGFSGYLTKPIQQSDLFNVLAKVSGITPDMPSETFVTRYSEEKPPQFNSHILVVDDVITNQLVIQSMLAKYGIRVDKASDGNETLVSLQRGASYDLVFMDCQMPNLDGYDATRKIRDPQTSDINHLVPVIAMIANAMQGDKEKCLAAGMNDYISKPIYPKALLQMLEKWLGEKLV